MSKTRTPTLPVDSPLRDAVVAPVAVKPPDISVISWTRETPIPDLVKRTIPLLKRHDAWRALRVYQGQAGCPAVSRWSVDFTARVKATQQRLLSDEGFIGGVLKWILTDVGAPLPSPNSAMKCVQVKAGEAAILLEMGTPFIPVPKDVVNADSNA